MKRREICFLSLFLGLLLVGCSDGPMAFLGDGEEAIETVNGLSSKGNARIVSNGEITFIAGHSESPNRPIKYRSLAFEVLEATDRLPAEGGVRFTVLNEDSSLHRETTIILDTFYREGRTLWMIGDVVADTKYGGGGCADGGGTGGCDHGDGTDTGGCDGGSSGSGGSGGTDGGGCDHGDTGGTDTGGCDHSDTGGTDTGGCDHGDGTDTGGCDGGSGGSGGMGGTGGCDHTDTGGTDTGGCDHSDTGGTDTGGCDHSDGTDTGGCDGGSGGSGGMGGSGGCDHGDTGGTDTGGCDHGDGTDTGGCDHGDTGSGGCSGGGDTHGGGSDCQGGACGHSGSASRVGNVFMAKFVDGGIPAVNGDAAAWKWKVMYEGANRPDITHHDNWKLCEHPLVEGNVFVRDW